MFNSKRMLNVVGATVGAIIGFALGRMMLRGIEELAFRMFLEGVGEFGLGRVLGSTTFWKIAIGTLGGAVAGWWLGGRVALGTSTPQPIPPPGP